MKMYCFAIDNHGRALFVKRVLPFSFLQFFIALDNKKVFRCGLRFWWMLFYALIFSCSTAWIYFCLSITSIHLIFFLLRIVWKHSYSSLTLENHRFHLQELEYLRLTKDYQNEKKCSSIFVLKINHVTLGELKLKSLKLVVDLVKCIVFCALFAFLSCVLYVLLPPTSAFKIDTRIM